jgi:hypothetical protein
VVFSSAGRSLCGSFVRSTAVGNFLISTGSLALINVDPDVFMQWMKLIECHLHYAVGRYINCQLPERRYS